MFLRTLIIILLSLLNCGFVLSQQYYKIKCNITIKEKLDSTTFSLYKGTAYYNKYEKISLYDFSFPQKEKWIISEDSIIKVFDNKIVFAEKSELMNNFSIFNLFLDGTLKNYGLQKSNFTITDVRQNKHSDIMSTWLPPENLKKYFGKVIISQHLGNIKGVAIYDPQNNLIVKQVYSDYIPVKNLQFPSKITYIYYNKGIERYKVILFNNIILE